MRELRDLLFADSQLVRNGVSVVERLTEENAHIIVLNGSNVPGLARSTNDYLTNQDFQVVGIGDASTLYDNTLIVDHTGKRYTSKQLASLLRLPLDRVVSGNNPEGDYDVTLILGSDFELPEG
jgi:hypothetical protein